MAFDEALADRIRDVLASRPGLSERKMFGGDLMVRLDPADAEKALQEPHTRPMDFTGRPAKNMVYVDPKGTASDEDLAAWVEAGADYATSLPPK